MATVLIYATRRQRKQLTGAGSTFLAEYDDYVLADISADQMAALQAAGYEVEIQEPPRVLEVRGRSVTMLRAEERDAAQPAARAAAMAEAGGHAILQGPAPETYGPGQHYYLVQFVGPTKPEWLAEITTHGGKAQGPVPPYGYIVALDQPTYDWLTTEPAYVRWVGHYSPELRLAPELTAALAADPALSRGRIRRQDEAPDAAPPGVERVPALFTVSFFEPHDLPEALPYIRELGGTSSAFEPGAAILTVSFPPDQADLPARVERLAHLHGVKAVETFTLRQLYNNVAVRLLAAEEVITPRGLGLSGRGEIVGVADSGLDNGDPAAIHPDFAERIAAIRSWPVAADWSALVTNSGGDDGPADTRSGHGTHVAGSVCGNGSTALAAGHEAIRGLAFGAELVFQAIEQELAWTDAYRQTYYRRYRRNPPDYGLAGLPVDLQPVFQQAYDAGVRIHNNSWGGGDFGAYDDYAAAVDRFMWQHKDFLILFAAGNDGTDGDRDGDVDDGSVSPPGTAKNCLTVGAAESVRAQGGYQRAYGRLWPGSFPARPVSADMPSDHADDVAAFSSRGPTKDGRIKPDLVAPGTNILSVRSRSLGADSHGWGAYVDQLQDQYMFDGGTSMATPLVTGAAALIRQYLRRVKRRRTPSAALLKATLLHAAQYRPERHVQDGEDRLHDFAQGWGHLDLGSVLLPPAPEQVSWYDHRRGLNSGQSWRWSCQVVDPGVSLKVTLVWTDYPGNPGHQPNLVNDLDLVLTSPSGQMYYGNCAPGQIGGRPDRVNNVERIILPTPEPGRYRIRVRAVNVLYGPQDFALVYSGGMR
ncbi:MAG: serine protease [Chloroflexi bacterium HGW-Chloroflexi-1]|nr:MAG: serine protease [Chloroflexi bacterium HGW-Chloroflexi-1]